MDDRRKDHPIRELLAHFDALYSARYGTRYPFSGGKDAKLVQGLRALYADEQIRQLMDGFFALEDDFIVRAGHSLGAFRGCLPQVIQYMANGQRSVEAGRRAVPGRAAWRDACRHEPRCRTVAQHQLAEARAAKISV